MCLTYTVFIFMSYRNLFIVSLQYISSTRHMLYLLNFQYNIYNYFATCFDSSESSSGIRFKTYCMYLFIIFCLTVSFLLQKRSLFFAFQTRVIVYLVCSKVIIYVYWKLSKYSVCCVDEIYCTLTINRLSYHTMRWLLIALTENLSGFQ